MTGASDFHRSRLSEHLFARSAAEKQSQRPPRRARPRKNTTTPVRVAEQDHARFILVANDLLIFRVVTLADRQVDNYVYVSQATPPAPTPNELLFRHIFAVVWERLPVSDRQLLLKYWRARSAWNFQASQWLGPQYRPLVQFFNFGSLSSTVPACTRFGHILNFPDQELTEGQWTELISHTLAHVYLIATETWWGLVERMVEKPLDRWERKQGARATDERMEKEHVRLDKLFVPAFEAEILKVLRRWGFTESAVPPMPSTPQPKGQD